MGKADTVEACLAKCGIADPKAALGQCPSLEAEFATVKKSYFKLVLVAHPDKGGSEEAFRELQAAFDVLRDLCVGGHLDSYLTAISRDTSKQYSAAAASAKQYAPQSWDFFAAAADEPVPGYRVELAKSGRSKCQAKGSAKHHADSEEVILNKTIRIGSLEPEAGSYGRWVHLGCWRVPARVWLGLPEPEKCKDPTKFEAALLGMTVP
ncbi:hypothetical protein T492DRAFT_850847 [Pavlovales sp. CCMP2436]|nr:hypothetical protein T492DRAFT_850847 [Pavlovales sp. CCMP2436]